jgi:hypothetical protein
MGESDRAEVVREVGRRAVGAAEDDGWGSDRPRAKAIADARRRVADAVVAGDAVDPFAHPDVRPAQREQLRAVSLDSARRLPRDGHVSEVYAVEQGDVLAYLKPAAGESDARHDIPRGEQALREIATGIVDEELGFELVPATVVRHDEPYGYASLQMHAPGDAKPLAEYDAADRQRMAVLDYITGQTDRHAGNYRSQDDGRPAAIDNGLSFPEGNADPLRSVFFDALTDQSLDPDVQRQVDALEVDRLEQRLRAAGLSEAAISGMQARLDEARSGRITGRAYGWDLRTG